jgi:hypothetical protein
VQPRAKSWRDVLQVHPAAELFPPMSEAELCELGEDIKQHGVTSRIALWSPGVYRKDAPVFLLDGRNRLDGMEAVGICLVKNGEFDYSAVPPIAHLHEQKLTPSGIVTACDPHEYVLSANIHRRHLTAEQKRELIVKLLKTTPEKSNRQIAGTVKASHVTVGTIRTEMESTGQVDQLPKTVGKDRKARPSKRKRPPTEDAKRAAVPKPPPAKTAVREAAAPDEELDLLREFARFVIAGAHVSTDPKDQIEWTMLLDRVKQVLAAPAAESPSPDSGEMSDIPDSPRCTPPGVLP